MFSTVFLDRDGTINRRIVGDWVSREEDFVLLPGVGETLAAWQRAGLRLIVISNQRGVEIGRLSAADVDRIHAYMASLLLPFGVRLDAIYYAPTGSGPRAKPAPGMFHDAKRDFPAIDLAKSVMIGDALRDCAAGAAAGCATILLAPPEERDAMLAEAKAKQIRVDHCVASLSECRSLVLARD
ncbi:MAG: HAD-IIIA family hydrolase [Phycisphaerales bacterium]|nr:HAD-IIIA family hydrolase [Phycisphaerales bacterium]